MNIGTRANEFPKRYKGWKHFGIKLKKIVEKTTTNNKEYKQARWRDVNHNKHGKWYCSVCGSKCVGWFGLKPKRNRGQKPRNKNKPWRKIQ